MKTVRRLYFYAVALISLEVVLWGLIGLLRTIVDKAALGTGSALAQALALVVVGVPIFLVHWLWAQRASAKDEEEQTASLRALFLYAALIGTLIPVVQNLLALINRLLLGGAALHRPGAVRRIPVLDGQPDRDRHEPAGGGLLLEHPAGNGRRCRHGEFRRGPPLYRYLWCCTAC
jgi:uncharacterized membrane protein YuzA (DUF378 family)